MGKNNPADRVEENGAIVPVDTDRVNALVLEESPQSDMFASYTEEREMWMSTKSGHNSDMAKQGVVFTILMAQERIMPATKLDEQKGLEVGEDKPMIAYRCAAQMPFEFRDEADAKNDVSYAKGETFVIMMNANAMRRADLARVQELLKKGPIFNVALQQYKPKPGQSAPVGLVAAQQWKPLRDR